MKFKLSEDKTKLILLESTREEYNQLKLSLSKYVDNYYFKAKYKMTKWDGKIEFLHIDKINFGLWYEVYKICKEFGYPFQIVNKEEFPINKNLKKEEIEEFCKEFYKEHKDEKDPTKPFFPHDHQIEAIFKILKHKYGIIEVATSGGKSLIFSTIVFYYLTKKNSKNPRN